ncbi:hypothetical protein BH09ACT4_BH09ACT4_16980 [soil metagenome]
MTTILRIGLGILALIMLVVGTWNQFWPHEFYDNFPGVSDLPPFSEHLSRDFGGTSLGLGVVLACAVAVPRTVLVIPALLGTWAWSLPHFVFHMMELDHGSAADAAFNIVATGGAAVLPPILLTLAVVRARQEHHTRTTMDP